MTDESLTKVPVKDLRIGDSVDLYGDEYADPDRDPGNSYEFERVEVVEVERETPDCVSVGFESAGLIGFPPDHMLPVDRDTPQFVPCPECRYYHSVDDLAGHNPTIEDCRRLPTWTPPDIKTTYGENGWREVEFPEND